MVSLNREDRFIIFDIGISRNFAVSIVVITISIGVQLKIILFLEDGGN